MQKKQRIVKKSITFDYMNKNMASDLISKAYDRCSELEKKLWMGDASMTKILRKLSGSVWAKLAFSICLQSIQGEKNAKQQILIINDFRQLLDVHCARNPQCLGLGSHYDTIYSTLCVFIDEYRCYQKTHAISKDFWIYSELDEDQHSVVIQHAEQGLKYIQDVTTVLIDEMTVALEQRICLVFPELKSLSLLSALHDAPEQRKISTRRLRFSESNTIHDYELDHSENTLPSNQTSASEHVPSTRTYGLVWQSVAPVPHVAEQEEGLSDGLRR